MGSLVLLLDDRIPRRGLGFEARREDFNRQAAGTEEAGVIHPGFLYGRITTVDGATYEGRLRWGGNQEAFWGDYFNEVKDESSWGVHVPPERLPMERSVEPGIRDRPQGDPDRARPAVHDRAPPPPGCTGSCARARATSPASSNGTGRSASAPTSSTATPPAERNAGLLVFIEGVPRPEYVPWAEVGQVDFDRPPTMYPPLGGG